MGEVEHPTPIAAEGPREPEQREVVPNGGLGRHETGAWSHPLGETNSAKPLAFCPTCSIPWKMITES